MKLIELYLACWRLTSLIVSEDGPFDVFGKMRHAIGVRYDEWGTTYGLNAVAHAITCTWCTSVWVSLFLLIIRRFILGRRLIRLLAVSGGAILIGETIIGLERRSP